MPLPRQENFNLMKITNTIACILLVGLMGCQEKAEKSDAYGNFEATEVLVSAEANGRLLSFEAEEGETLAAGQVVGWVDTMPHHLKKKQLLAGIRAVRSKTQNVDAQERVYQQQLRVLEKEKKRVEKLLQDSAATPKQLDDIEGQMGVVEKQMQAHLTRLSDANRGISAEVDPLLAQIQQIDDQIARSKVTNPLTGRVLTKFAEPQEITAFGKPLYKIAELDEVFLRVYVSGDQLPALSLGQEVKVKFDKPEGAMEETSGKISWIASEAEFTPKTIQTKEERVNLVYAVKVKVPNPEGKLKIGMPGEVEW
jgi:HlyD family secretion protein